MNKKPLVKILAALIILVSLTPSLAFAETELSELNDIIKEVNEKRATPEESKKLEDKLIDTYGHRIAPSAISRVMSELKPGDALVLAACAKVCGKPIEDMAEIRKTGAGCDAIAEKMDTTLKKVLKEVKRFRSVGC
jgi:hypothetical protein